MNLKYQVTAFHGMDDHAASANAGKEKKVRPDPRTPHFAERSLQYRFHPHFHPYTAELINRLIEGSVRGLQDADTEYALESGAPVALPQSTRVKMPDGKSLTLPEPFRVRLNGELEVALPSNQAMSYPEGTGVELLEQIEVTFLDGSSATYPRGTIATLIGIKPRPKLYEEIFTEARYKATDLVAQPYPVRDLDFSSGGAYAAYNWELFYHVPITVAIHLSKNQRFAEAQRWFHYVFDPTDDSDGPTPERFWKVRPFQYTEVKLIEEILVNLVTGADPDLRFTTIKSIDAWMDAPFRPHLVARYRQTPYMFKAVTAYLDNLIAWGDSLFREDTRESINEAMQVYVLAANILGERPQMVPKKGTIRPQTYANLKMDLGEFGTALREVEDGVGYDLGPYPEDPADIERYNTLRSIGHALYFCVPRNDKLFSYWDTVADRLFKIRNSLNIQGIFRQLPLFEPPIDPALLAKATAAGLDVGAVISGVNQPLPLVRFQFLLQKAIEIVQEVKTLGNSFLATIEKEDNEALPLLRAKHESSILRIAESVKYGQWQEALKALEGSKKTFDNVVERYKFYERLLTGKSDSEVTVEEADELDAENLEKMAYGQTETELALRDIEIDNAADLEDDTEVKNINVREKESIDQMEDAREKQHSAGIYDNFGAVFGILPNVGIAFKPMGVGMSLSFGGSNLAAMMSAMSNFKKEDAAVSDFNSNMTAKTSSFDRRAEEWSSQSRFAAGEINQIYKQIRGHQIHAQLAKREWANHKTQIKFAEETEQFLKGEAIDIPGASEHRKTTTQSFYAWMKREVKGLYGQVFQFAFDIAKKAERALQHELGNPTLSFIEYEYLSGKEGLLAGEKLYLDIKRMEMAYHDQRRREYELTKHISLQQLEPLALMQLRATGSCTVALPEALFDMDCPGHYFRRIKSVAVSIPCVVGAYSSVNCTLTLLKSSIRKSALLSGVTYAREGSGDIRFSDHFGSLESIVTSSSQSDAGLFESSLNEERYLPFENSGVISEWRLQLPADPSADPPQPLQFDYDTISDVIMHVRYTAREGGELLRQGAIENLATLIESAEASGSVRLFSLRHEFPTAWAAFKGAETGGQSPYPLTINLQEEHYPFWSKSRLNVITWANLYVKANEIVSIAHEASSEETYLVNGDLGNLKAVRLEQPPGSPIGDYTLYLNTNDVDELWLAVAWGAGGGA